MAEAQQNTAQQMSGGTEPPAPALTQPVEGDVTPPGERRNAAGAAAPATSIAGQTSHDDQAGTMATSPPTAVKAEAAEQTAAQQQRDPAQTGSGQHKGSRGPRSPEPEEPTASQGHHGGPEGTPDQEGGEAEHVTSRGASEGAKVPHEFAFKPVRPRSTRVTARRAAAQASALTEVLLTNTATGNNPPSALDSLAAVAAAWGEEEEGAELLAGRPRSTDDGYHGDYGDYDDDDNGQDDEDDGDDEGEGGRRSSRRQGIRRTGTRGQERSGEMSAEEAGLYYAATSGRPELDQCPPDVFEADLVSFLSARGERQLAAHVREKRITCNSLPLDIYGLYREVVRRGGYIANERYDDKGSRWTGTINFAGEIFPRLKNWTVNNRATSVGSQLLNNYRKFLLAYERAYLRWDLPHTEMAQQQRAAASAAGAQTSKAAAAAIAAANLSGPKMQWDYEGMMTLSFRDVIPPAMPQPSRRSTGGGAAAGHKRSTSQAQVQIYDGGWQGGYTDNDRDEDMGVQQTRSASWGGGDATNVMDVSSGGAHQGPSKKRRHTTSSADVTPGAAMPLALPAPGMAGPLANVMPVGPHQPGVRKVQQLQQLWTNAQISQVIAGQQCLLPGQLLLAQDPTQPNLQWAVLVADLGELPLEVADGLRVPNQPLNMHVPPALPMKLAEATHSGRLEDATPVLLLGSTAIGWVERVSCRPATAASLATAMASAWSRVNAVGGPGSPGHAVEYEMACIRGLKEAVELLAAATAQGSLAGVNGAPLGTVVKDCVPGAAMSHTSRKLLDLEGMLCPTSVAASATAYWQSWRTAVASASSPATLSTHVLALAHQITPMYLASIETLWPELLALLGLSPPVPTAGLGSSGSGSNQPLLVSGREGEPSCLGVDMAVSLLQSSINWPLVHSAWTNTLAMAATPARMPADTTGATMGAWGMPGGMPSPPPPQLPMAPMAPMPSNPSGTGAAEKSQGGQASRKPLPPVGSTAPPQAAPVAAGFSSRGAAAAGTQGPGLPPRPPPPVRVNTGSTPGTAPSTGGQPVSPNSTGQQLTPSGPPSANGLSPLRVVPANPTPSGLTQPGTEGRAADAALAGMGGLGVIPMGRTTANSRVGSPSSILDLGAPQATATPSPLVVTTAAGVPNATASLPNPAPAAGVVTFTQPAQQQPASQPGAAPAAEGGASKPLPSLPTPLDLSAPPTSSTAGSAGAYSANPSPGTTTFNLLSPPSIGNGVVPQLQILNANGTEQLTVPYKGSLSSPGILGTPVAGGLGLGLPPQQPIVAIPRESVGGVSSATVTTPGSADQVEGRMSVSGAQPASTWTAPSLEALPAQQQGQSQQQVLHLGQAAQQPAQQQQQVLQLSSPPAQSTSGMQVLQLGNAPATAAARLPNGVGSVSS